MGPFIEERLRRFRPKGGTIDRDSLLFAAGRASAQPNRLWKGLSAVLGVTQVLTLAYFFGSPTAAPTPIVQAPRRNESVVPRRPVEARRRESSSNPARVSAQFLIDGILKSLERDDIVIEEQMVPSPPPLYASSAGIAEVFDEVLGSSAQPGRAP